MARRYKPQHMKNSKSNSTLNWSEILINALLNLLIGTLLILIEKILD